MNKESYEKAKAIEERLKQLDILKQSMEARLAGKALTINVRTKFIGGEMANTADFDFPHATDEDIQFLISCVEGRIKALQNEFDALM